ncbi:hypothetical protein TI39_contig481g00037 [Zymoseptoria brevis]|uniref:Extracellular protein n=1 Tax=Zymoseptoria brevis TaxID=1047168 RepID=A0A0F4GJY4_9PEZI|nr:hypothetical protein TI39_contig481g00037 [Zymoseptoria brevis]
MFSSTSLSAACLLLASVQPALAHMEMRWPLPLHSKFNPDTPENKIDYSMTSPLKNDGSDFPCKGYQNDRPFVPTASYTAGQTYNMTLAGTATHEGGSCQLSLSYDNGATFKVIKSMIGGCPLIDTYDFTIPSYAPAGNALFAWTWQNRVGNREMYMNCAEVSITSNTRQRKRQAFNTFESLPYLWKANLAGLNGCETTERVDPVYGNPGPDVVFGGGLSEISIPFVGECDAPQPFGQTFRDLGDTPAPGDAGTTTSSTMSETATSTDSSTSATSDSTTGSSSMTTSTDSASSTTSATFEPETSSSTSPLGSETTSTIDPESSTSSDLESSTTTLEPQITTAIDPLEPDVPSTTFSATTFETSTTDSVTETTSIIEQETTTTSADQMTTSTESSVSTESSSTESSSTESSSTESSSTESSSTTTAPPVFTPPFMNGTMPTISFTTSSEASSSTSDIPASQTGSMSSSTEASAVTSTSSTSGISSSTPASTTGQSTTGASSSVSATLEPEITSTVTAPPIFTTVRPPFMNGTTTTISFSTSSTTVPEENSTTSTTSDLSSSTTSNAPAATRSVFALEVSGVQGIADGAKGAIAIDGTFIFAEENTATILALLENGKLVDSNGFAASVPTTRKRQESADGSRIFFVSTQDASFEACVCEISSANALSCTCDLLTGFKIGQGADLGVLAIGTPEGLFDIFAPEAAPIEIPSTTTSASSTAFETSTTISDSSSTTATSSAPGETSTSSSSSATDSNTATSTAPQQTSTSSFSIRTSSDSSTASSTASEETSTSSSSTASFATTAVTTECTTTATLFPTTSMTSISSTSTATVTPTDSSIPPFATADPNSRTTGYAPCVPGTFLCTSSTTWLTCVYNGGSLSSFAANEYVWKNSRTVAAGTECLPNLSPYTNLQGNFEQQSNVPEGYYRDDRYVRASPFGRCSNNGELRCANDGAAFQVCDNGGWVAMGNVAAGTTCSNGEIVAA